MTEAFRNLNFPASFKANLVGKKPKSLNPFYTFEKGIKVTWNLLEFGKNEVPTIFSWNRHGQKFFILNTTLSLFANISLSKLKTPSFWLGF